MAEIDYFKATEAYLYNYRSLKANIELNKIRMEQLELEQPTGLTGVNYEQEKLSKTYAFHSTTENEAIGRVSEYEKLRRSIEMSMYTVMRIEKAVEALTSLEKRVVKLRYFSDEQLTWRQIGDIVKYDPDYCRKEVRNRAINKIAVAIFGQDAIKTPVLPPPQAEKDVI